MLLRKIGLFSSCVGVLVMMLGELMSERLVERSCVRSSKFVVFLLLT